MKESQRILLHVCCGPCATASIERLIEDGWQVDLFFSNSNILSRAEYDKRLESAEKTAEYFKLKLLNDAYDHQLWLNAIKGLEDEPERGARCSVCFGYSLRRTAEAADAGGYDGFTTTLSISPYKDSSVLFSSGNSAGRFIEYNFKKKDGFKRSLELSKELNLYRQGFCGCEFSAKREARR